MENNADDTLVFLHIPKTAGRTLQEIMKRKYKPTEYILNMHSHLAQLDAMSDQKKRGLKYIQGHIAYGLHKKLPQNCRYFSIMRDPVDRVVSQYYYMKLLKDHPLHKEIIDKKLSLKDYVNSGVSKEPCNDQVRMISGSDGQDMLEVAKENISKHFYMVGLSEYFDETLLLLMKELGWRMALYGNRNINKARPRVREIDDETLNTIKKCNAMDIELYGFVKEKLLERMVKGGDSFYRELKTFHKLNAPYSRFFSVIRSMKHMFSDNIGK